MLRSWLFLGVVALLFSSQSFAEATYSYEGETFTSVDPPWTTENRVSGSFSLVLPLPASLPLTDLSSFLLEFQFEDGVRSWNPSNTTICGFSVATDSNGAVSEWQIFLREAPTPMPGEPIQVLDSGNAFGDQVGIGPAGMKACDTISLTSIASVAAQRGLGQPRDQPHRLQLHLRSV